MGMKEVGVWLLLGLHLHYCLVGGVGMDREIQKSLMKASTAAPARLISNSTISVERQESSQCKIVRPTFCTEVDWSVPEDQAEKVLRAKGDLQVEMMVINFQGTRECQREYKSLHCRYLYPKCGEDGQPKFPCKHECESFTKRCKGTLLRPCNSFPDSSQCAQTETHHHHRHHKAFWERIFG